ncbi:BRCT domain-containing protein, partial [Mycena pura]
LCGVNNSFSSGSRKSTITINIMSTVITLPDHVLKALMKLGAKTTTQVSLCTHLIAPSVVRTEKFLCALAAGAFILSEKWATESIAANKLLPEEDYILRDNVSERKWNFSLVDAMAQAKKVGGKLFENQTFYVTPRVPIDTKLLKTVVTAQGGKLSPQTPTMRLMNTAPNRYVISCPEDISVWRPLAEHHTIYSQELLLMAALTQDIDWKNPAFHITESG